MISMCIVNLSIYDLIKLYSVFLLLLMLRNEYHYSTLPFPSGSLSLRCVVCVYLCVFNGNMKRAAFLSLERVVQALNAEFKSLETDQTFLTLAKLRGGGNSGVE